MRNVVAILLLFGLLSGAAAAQTVGDLTVTIDMDTRADEIEMDLSGSATIPLTPADAHRFGVDVARGGPVEIRFSSDPDLQTITVTRERGMIDIKTLDYGAGQPTRLNQDSQPARHTHESLSNSSTNVYLTPVTISKEVPANLWSGQQLLKVNVTVDGRLFEATLPIESPSGLGTAGVDRPVLSTVLDPGQQARIVRRPVTREYDVAFVLEKTMQPETGEALRIEDRITLSVATASSGEPRFLRFCELQKPFVLRSGDPAARPEFERVGETHPADCEGIIVTRLSGGRFQDIFHDSPRRKE